MKHYSMIKPRGCVAASRRNKKISFYSDKRNRSQDEEISRM